MGLRPDLDPAASALTVAGSSRDPGVVGDIGVLVEAQQIVEWLTRKGDVATAFEAEGVLPPHVDTDR